MSMDMAALTPLTLLMSPAGGALIGVAAALLLLLCGRVAGVSSILGDLLRPVKGDVNWRLAFVLGLIAAPVLYSLFAVLPASRIETGDGVIVVAGLLVGLGTRYGSGCTSGHGVCGLSRFSLRSLVATLVFMVAGFVTVYVVRHLLHLA